MFTANSIAEKLKISRNLVSQYLNEFLKQNKVLKVNTRPVYFFPRFNFEKKYSYNSKDGIIKTLEELKTILKQDKNFQSIIGYNGSLTYLIEQCKGAICYPGKGLPILIYGETGTGKSMLAKEVFKYGLSKDIFSNEAPFITLNCSEFADNPNLLVANLFGYVKGAFTGAVGNNQGLLKTAENGVLFLDEIHCLKSECQEKLFLFMDQGIYHMLGDNKNWHKSNARLIFATTKKPEEALLKTLLRRIPIIIKIPSLEERPISEKSDLIKYLIGKEECRFDKEIQVSPIVFETLLNFNFKGNIGHLKNCIKASCANAFIENNKSENILKINTYNLPEYIIVNKEINLSAENNDIVYGLLKNNKLNLKDNKNSIAELIEDLIYLKQDDKEIKRILNKYFDNIVFKNEKNPKKYFIKNIINNIFETLKTTYDIVINHNTLIIISNLIFDFITNKIVVSKLEEIYNKELTNIEEVLVSKYIIEHKISNYIIDVLKSNIEFENKKMINIVLILILKCFSTRIIKDKTSCIIICHGYSTASSIAEAANKLLDTYIFDAIDMPLDISTNKIVKKLEEYFFMRPHIIDAILLVDMGSLEQIYTQINTSIKINLGIINNITTRLALDIGENLLENLPIEIVLKEACKNNLSTYRIIKNDKKEAALLLICSSGEGTAKKLKELFIKSFPKQIDLKIISSDYQSLTEEKAQQILNIYSIDYVIGTLNPKLKSLKYISLEKIINLDKNSILEIFSKYFEDDEIEIFKENLLKNFSIYNLLDHLTILNPDKVLVKVKEGVDILQKRLNKKLKVNTIIGLYIHISCLTERLITKNQIKTYKELEKLREENIETLNIIKECFSVLEDTYSVEIPEIELAYIFEYIKYD
nr:sigma 54-interacting transcriptional regulator [Cetobacterium somerae]